MKNNKDYENIVRPQVQLGIVDRVDFDAQINIK